MIQTRTNFNEIVLFFFCIPEFKKLEYIYNIGSYIKLNLKSKRQIKEVNTKIRIEEKEIELLNKQKKRMRLQKDSENSQSDSEHSVINEDEAYGSSTEPSTSSGIFVQQNSNNENSKIDYSTRKHLICKHVPIQRKKKGFNILFFTSETCQKNCLTRNRPDRAKNKNKNEKHKHFIVSMITPGQELRQFYKDENDKRENGWGRSEKIKDKAHYDTIVKVNKMKRSSKSSL